MTPGGYRRHNKYDHRIDTGLIEEQYGRLYTLSLPSVRKGLDFLFQIRYYDRVVITGAAIGNAGRGGHGSEEDLF